MVDKTKVTLGLILMTILATGVIYLQFDDLKIRIDEDKTTFYTLQNSRWVVSGRESSQLFDGTSLMYRDAQNINITYSIKGNTTLIKRITPYIRGPTVIDEYFFDGNNKDIELVPVTHKITILNAQGKFLRYEAFDLIYDGDQEKISGLRKDFGHNMSIEWQETNKRWAWVYMNGKLKIQFDIPSDNESYSIRMFDPIIEEAKEIDISVYDTKSKQEPIYEEKLVIVDSIYYKENDTWTEAYNYTTSVFVGYETVYYEEAIKNTVEIDGKVYPNSAVNTKENYVCVCAFPMGDIDWEKFPCRQYYIDKGICKKVSL